MQGNECVITAVLDDATPGGSVDGVIVVHTNNADQPRLELPVSAFVEDGAT